MAVGLKHDLFKQTNKKQQSIGNIVHPRHYHVVVCSMQGSTVPAMSSTRIYFTIEFVVNWQ